MAGALQIPEVQLATAPAAPAENPATLTASSPVPAGPSPGDILPWLPCTVALAVPTVGFTVRSLLELTAGSLVETACHQSTDIPLQVNGVLMAWAEFEVVGDRLAARITDLV